jgi:hypothetical protein
MSARNLSEARKTSNVIAASGRLKNDQFLLTADHILLEVDPETFELISARAEGNIQVHMVMPDPDSEYVIFAQSAVYHAEGQQLTLNGWIGTRENGIEYPPATAHREIEVPTDGSPFVPHMEEQAEKRLPIGRRVMPKAA